MKEENNLGRGAYICYNLECLEKAKEESKRIEKSLEIPISIEEIYFQIENIIKNKVG